MGTPDGRIYYLNHNTRTTSWNHPPAVTPPLPSPAIEFPQVSPIQKATSSPDVYLAHSSSNKLPLAQKLSIPPQFSIPEMSINPQTANIPKMPLSPKLLLNPNIPLPAPLAFPATDKKIIKIIKKIINIS